MSPPRRGIRRYHFHPPGLVYLGVTVLLAVGAVNSQNNLLFLALGLAIGGIIVSGLISGAPLMGLELSRAGIGEAAVGDPLTIRYTVRNQNRFLPLFGLHVVELGAWRDHHATWPSMMDPPHAHVAHLGPRRQVICEATAWPIRRGNAHFAAVRVWTTFPFGLVKKSMTFPLPASALVRPLVLELRPGAVDPARSHGSSGERPTRRLGIEPEFFSLREYVPGDSLRTIAWRPSARTESLVVKERLDAAPRKTWISLTLAPGISQGAPSREQAICLAASAAARAAAAGAAVGLILPDSGLAIPPGQGRRHLLRLLDALALCDLHTEKNQGHTPPGERVIRVAETGDADISADDFRSWIADPSGDPRLASVGLGPAASSPADRWHALVQHARALLSPRS